MKRRWFILLMALLAIVGIGLIAYPSFSNFLYIKNASLASQEYNEVVDQAAEEELAAIWQHAEAYNRALEGNPVKDPFLKGSGMVLSDDYGATLLLHGSHTMGYISLPTIGVNLPMFHGTSDAVLNEGIGHLEGSSLPIGGSGTHSVLTGHTGLSHAKIFTDLHLCREGELFFITILDKTLAYEIDQIKVVEPEDVSDLVRVKGEDYCTLITCTPYGRNTHRLLVRGTRTEYDPGVRETLEKAAPAGTLWFPEKPTLIGIGIGSGATVAMIVFVLLKHRKKREGEEILANARRARRRT